ncbi:hypothetical protein A7D03_11015 [Aeromonas salmonicida]|nr:hypothetical protein A7D03_11015 [Aeromonas salmonicida]
MQDFNGILGVFYGNIIFFTIINIKHRYYFICIMNIKACTYFAFINFMSFLVILFNYKITH